MFGLPPIPPLEGMHPIVVHFPIGILLIAWLPILVGVIDKKRRNAWFASAFMLLLVGTIGAFAAVFTGEATEETVGTTSQLIENAIHEHEEAAEMARNLFIATTIVFLAVWLTLAKINEKKKAMVAVAGGALVVAFYAVASLALANAGHLGGVLVHQHGIHAPITAQATPSGVLNDAIDELGDDDDD